MRSIFKEVWMAILKVILYAVDIIAIPISMVYYYYYYVPVLIYSYWCDGINPTRGLWTIYARLISKIKGVNYLFEMKWRAELVADASGDYTSLWLIISLLIITVLIDMLLLKKKITEKKKLPVIAWSFYILAIAMVVLIKFHGAPYVIDYLYDTDP